MRNLYFVLWFSIVFLACSKGKGPGDHDSITQDTAKTSPGFLSLDPDLQSMVVPKQPAEWTFINDQDTLLLGKFRMVFEPTESIFRKYYSDQDLRDSISSVVTGSLESSRAVETYLNHQWPELFHRSQDTLFLTLSEEKTIRLIDSPAQRYSLEHFFNETNYLLIKVLFQIGEGYLLVNSERPRIYYVWGRPYFSPSRQQVIVIHSDLLQQYGANGIQHFLLEGDSLQLLWERGVSNWGPVEAQWKDERSLIVRKEYLTPSESDEVYLLDELLITIESMDTVAI